MSRKNRHHLPQLRNPLEDLIKGNMPGLPQIIQNSMPVELPRASFQQSSLGLFWGNVKRNQLVKSTKAEAEIAEYSHRSVVAKLNTVTSLVTYSAGIAESLECFEHRKAMRNLEIQERQAQVYLIQAQAKQAGHEAQLSELDYNIRMKQYKKMDENTDVG
jgi:hypothetical protein